MRFETTINDLLPLKHNNFVRLQVVEFELAPFLDDVGVFAHQQPADVREEEAPHGVVRVGLRLRVLVVNPVVSSPFVDIILEQGRKVACAVKTLPGETCVCVCVSPLATC